MRWAVLAFLLFFASSPAFGAIAYDTSTSSKASSGTSVSWSHTTTSGSNLLLVVGVFVEDATAGDRAVSSVTYNSVNMTRLVTQDYSGGGMNAEIWYLVNPSTGANTVNVTLGGTVDDVFAGATTYTGVDQTTPMESYAGLNGYNSPTSITIRAYGANSWLYSVIGNASSNSNIDVDSSTTTERWEQANFPGGAAGGTHGPVSAGVNTISWQHTNNFSAICAMAIRPAGETPATGVVGAQSTIDSSVSSLSWKQSVSGADRLLIVGVGSDDATSGDRVVSSVTFNGINLTNAHSKDYSTAASRCELWQLRNPPAGFYTITVTMAGTVTRLGAGSLVMTGMNPYAVVDATGSGEGYSSTASSTVTTITDRAYVVDLVLHHNVSGLTPGAGQTEYWEQYPGGDRSLAMTLEGPKTPAGSVTMDQTVGSDNYWTSVAAAFKQKSSGENASFFGAEF